jgi:hypothetical protein
MSLRKIKDYMSSISTFEQFYHLMNSFRSEGVQKLKSNLVMPFDIKGFDSDVP